MPRGVSGQGAQGENIDIADQIVKTECAYRMPAFMGTGLPLFMSNRHLRQPKSPLSSFLEIQIFSVTTGSGKPGRSATGIDQKETAFHVSGKFDAKKAGSPAHGNSDGLEGHGGGQTPRGIPTILAVPQLDRHTYIIPRAVSEPVLLSAHSTTMPYLNDSFVPSGTSGSPGELHETLADALSAGYRYLKSLKDGGTADESARKRLAEAGSKLQELATAPKEYLDILSGNNQILISVRWLVHLNVLDHVPLEGSIAYSKLASAANVPESQLKSVARMAMTNGFLTEPEPGYVSHSRFSALLSKDAGFMAWARFLTDYSLPAAYRFPEATQKWGETDKKTETAFNIGMNKQMPFFDYVREEPGMATMFSSYMRNVASTEGISFHHLTEGFAWGDLPAGSLVVDVGGSKGHASLALAKEYSHLKFLIQDLPETITGAEEAIRSEHPALAPRIKFMKGDFFGTQSVVDGDVYLLRMIIHDWPDVEAMKILTNLKAALKKPGARIIIMDTVLPEPGSIPALEERKLRVRDLTMVQVFNAKEREYEAWNQLITKAGLRIINTVQPSGSVMGLLEVGLPEEETRSQAPTGTRSEPQNDGVDSIHVNGSVNGVKTSNGGVQKPIIIIGGGIGGLCLAQGLKKAGIEFKVYERDPVLDYRPQGYRLKIEADGDAALKACLSDEVYERFRLSCAVTTVGQTDYNPVSGSILRSREGTGLAAAGGLSASATVDRGVFREILTTGIREHITFGKDVASYVIDDAEQGVAVSFKDGTSVHGSFLVGADGVRSSVRKTMLPDAKYVDTGAICIYGKTPMSSELLEHFPSFGLRWMTSCIDEAPSIQSILIGQSPLTLLCEPIRFPAENRKHMKLPEDYVYWVMIGRKELFAATPSEAVKLSRSEHLAGKAVDLSLELTKEWHPSISSLIRLQDRRQSSTMQVVSALPNIAPWKPSRYVTLVSQSLNILE